MVLPIDEMKSRLKGGTSHQNLFRVWINFPVGVGTANDTDSSSFLVKGASEPASRVGSIPVNGPGGGTLYISGDREFDEWTVTVLNDSKQSLRQIFEKWVNLQKSSGENTGATSFEYMTNCSYTRLDRAGNPTVGKTLYNTFPTEVSSIDLNFDTKDSIEEFTVNFRYSHFI